MLTLLIQLLFSLLVLNQYVLNQYDASNEPTKGDMQRVESAWSVPHDMLHSLRGRQELNTMVTFDF